MHSHWWKSTGLSLLMFTVKSYTDVGFDCTCWIKFFLTMTLDTKLSLSNVSDLHLYNSGSKAFRGFHWLRSIMRMFAQKSRKSKEDFGRQCKKKKKRKRNH
jgi:uncharacterized membrane protein